MTVVRLLWEQIDWVRLPAVRQKITIVCKDTQKQKRLYAALGFLVNSSLDGESSVSTISPSQA